MHELSSHPISPERSQKDWKYWFDGLMQDLRSNLRIPEEDRAMKEWEESYQTIFSSDKTTKAQVLRETSSKYLIERIIRYYLLQLRPDITKIRKLALQLTDAKIMAWAEIEDDDTETEDKLCKAEARTNARFSDHGFYLDSIIIEESDKLDIPSQYSVVIPNN